MGILKELRDAKGMTQSDVAHYLSMSRSFYAGIECGARPMHALTPENVEGLEFLYDIPEDDGRLFYACAESFAKHHGSWGAKLYEMIVGVGYEHRHVPIGGGETDSGLPILSLNKWLGRPPTEEEQAAHGEGGDWAVQWDDGETCDQVGPMFYWIPPTGVVDAAPCSSESLAIGLCDERDAEGVK